VTGHLWTLLPTLAEALRPATAPAAVPWSTTVEDDVTGTLTLHGWLADPGSDTLVVLVHGIASSPDARYVKSEAARLHDRGYATLRLGLRGTDRQGQDIYHAGHTADIHAAVASLPGYSRIWLVGFSLGGSNCGNALMDEVLDPRVAGGVAVCPPVDLALGQLHIDHARRIVYRRHVLSGLKETQLACVARHGAAEGWLGDHTRVPSLAEWDARVVVPRFGFEDIQDYYRRASLAGRLHALRAPLAVLACRADPMIPFLGATRAFESAPEKALLLEVRGGHVYGPLRDGTSAVEHGLRALEQKHDAAGVGPAG
jgi:uncharacterized protein